MRKILNTVAIYISVIAFTFSQSMPAYAGLIGTEQIMAEHYIEIDRESLREILDRSEARTILEKHGITRELAQQRINAMTDQEVRLFAKKFEELPAAGSIGVVAALLILVLLFIALELSGKTDVFSGL